MAPAYLKGRMENRADGPRGERKCRLKTVLSSEYSSDPVFGLCGESTLVWKYRYYDVPNVLSFCVLGNV